MKDEQFCTTCNQRMFYVEHHEPSDDGFSDESYWECPNGCDEVDTCTEYGTVKVRQDDTEIEVEVL